MKHSHSCQSMPFAGSSSGTESKCVNNPEVVVTPSNINTNQEALLQQLELARQKSRSTFLDRPRAKSEELMVVKQKFPHQMPDAQKNGGCSSGSQNGRHRMQSDSCLQTAGKTTTKLYHFFPLSLLIWLNE